MCAHAALGVLKKKEDRGLWGAKMGAQMPGARQVNLHLPASCPVVFSLSRLFSSTILPSLLMASSSHQQLSARAQFAIWIEITSRDFLPYPQPHTIPHTKLPYAPETHRMRNKNIRINKLKSEINK